MTDLLHRIHMGKLNFDYADYLGEPEYKQLLAEEEQFMDQINAVMGDSFTAKCTAATAAVGAYTADKDFQEGVRLGAQLVLALLEPLK